MSEKATPDKEERAGAPAVNFNVTKLIEVESSVEAATEAAISTVWGRHMNLTTLVNVTYANTVVLPMPDGSETLVDSVYDTSTDTIMVAVGSFADKYPKWTVEQMSALCAGHETRHKVQHATGDSAPDSNMQLDNGTYYDSRHEIEAHTSAIEALADIYPGQRFSFVAGTHVYANYQDPGVTIYVQ